MIKHNSTVNVTVGKSYEIGTDFTIKVDSNATVNVTINGKQYSVDAGGHVDIVTADLPAGNYTVTATVYESDKYYGNSTSKSFIVYKHGAVIDNIIVPSGKVGVGKNATITVNMGNVTSGVLLIEVGGHNYTVDIVGKVAVLNVVLPVGKYNARAYYLESDMYNATASVLSSEFLVADKELAIINITAPAVVVVDNNITFTVDNITAVNVTVNGVEVKVKDGKYTYKVTEAGIATIIVRSAETNDYYAGFNSTTVNVLKHNSTVEIALNPTYHVGDTVEITVTTNASEVNVTVNGKIYPVVNNKVTIPANETAAGKYIVTATVYENDKFMANTTTEQFEIIKHESEVSVTVDPIKVGETAVINITAPDYNGSAIVSVNSNNYIVSITDGFGQLNITGFSNGTYPINVTYLENAKYNQNTNTTTLEVSKVQSFVNVIPKQIFVGENEVIIFNVPTDATGNITVIVDGETYNIAVSGGKGTLTIEGLDKGEYHVNATYNGDGKYSPSVNNTQMFKVIYQSGEMKVVDEKNGTIIVYLHDNATGTVAVEVEGDVYNVTVSKGVAVVTLTNTTPGNHTAHVIYSGDSEFNTTEAFVEVFVPKYSSEMNISVSEFKVDDVGYINVTLPENATGMVIIEINGKSYNTTNIRAGIATFEIGNLTAGDKTFVVRYLGDSNYVANLTVATLTVNKHDSSISVAGDNIDAGETAQITITGPADIEGVVVVNVNGVNYTAMLTSGMGSVDVSNLANGTYVIKATYLENAKYKQSVNDSSVIVVSKVATTIDVNVENITYGENAVFEITLPDDVTGNVTIRISDNITVTSGVTGGLNRIVVDNIPVGVYSVNVTYNGNGKYLKASGIAGLEVVPENITGGIIVEDFANGTVAVYVPGNASGNVTLTLNNHNYTADVENGVAIITLDNETPGVHEVSVIYSGDATHAKAVINTTVTLGKYLTPIHIDVTETPVGEKVHIVVTTPENSTGVIFIEIDGVKYNESLSDGQAVFDIENLTAGVKTVIAVYEGDDNYLLNITTDKFTVYKLDSSISLDVTDIDVGETAQITITGPGDIEGVVVVNVNGVNYTAMLTSGMGSVDVSNLANGTYVIKATYLENAKYKQSVNDSSVIVVSKVATTIDVNVENITYGENAVFEITLPDDVTGNVTIRISDNITVTSGVTGGLNRIVVDNIPVGDYSVNVTYNGNDKYLTASRTVTLKVDSEIIKDSIKVDDLGNGTLVVYVPDNATGNITVDVNGNQYTANIKNGTAVLTLTDETPGNYNATVTYSGDETHEGEVVNVLIKISKYSTPLTIDVNNTFVGKNTVIIVTVPQNITGNVWIEINGVKYNKTATGGKAVFVIDNLAAGVKTVAATYNGDDSYVSNSTTAQFTVFKNTAAISIEVTPAADAVIKVFDLPDDATGYVIVNLDGKEYAINITSSIMEITVPLKAGTYTATATYLGDGKYLSNETSESFTVNKTSPDVEIEVDNTTAGSDVVVKVTVPDDATGNVTVTIGNITKVVNVTGGENVITVPGMGEGTYEVNVTYSGDDHYGSKTVIKYVTISSSIVTPSEHLTRGWDSSYDYQAEFFDKNGNILPNTDVQFVIDGKTYTVKTDSEGIAYLTDSHLAVGTYNVTVINPVTGQQVTNTLTIIKRIVDNDDLTMDFVDGHYYVVKVIGDDGNPVCEGEFVSITVNGVSYPCKTDKDGCARLKINLNPAKYTITAEYKNFIVSNKLVVKQILKLVKKTVKVKKGKKLVLKAKLKWTLKSNKSKSLKGKKIVFKFKGKTYKAKTNKKGIAKVTIKSKVTKKLKKGKKYAYTAKYITNIVKGKVKVKK